jgi:hypothetical protein
MTGEGAEMFDRFMEFSLLGNIWTKSEAHQTSCPIGTGPVFYGNKAIGV